MYTNFYCLPWIIYDHLSFLATNEKNNAKESIHFCLIDEYALIMTLILRNNNNMSRVSTAYIITKIMKNEGWLVLIKKYEEININRSDVCCPSITLLPPSVEWGYHISHLTSHISHYHLVESHVM